MRFVRHYRSGLVFGVLLVVCSVLIIRQIHANEHRHIEVREAFILLFTKGYQPQAKHLFQHLLSDLEHLSDDQLLGDFQRTLTLVDVTKQNPDNLIWKYHWTVSNEMEKRSVTALTRALKLAEQP